MGPMNQTAVGTASIVSFHLLWSSKLEEWSFIGSAKTDGGISLVVYEIYEMMFEKELFMDHGVSLLLMTKT